MDALTLSRLPAGTESLRAKLRAFLDTRMASVPPQVRARSWMGFDAGFSRALAREGLVGLTLPREWGGAGLGAFDRFVVVEELLARGAPVAAHWIADRQSGPLIHRYGTPQQKAFYLPRICRGEAFFGIGMSEPGAGSDLASVRSKAIRTDSGWQLTGQKIWTTHAQHAHYLIALVRTTGTAADRQQGLSQFIVDLSLPGVTVRPIVDLAGDAHFSEVFFDDVALAEDALIGEEGAGWEQVNAELAFERSGPERIYSSIIVFDTWLQWLRTLPAPEEWAVTLAGRIVAHLAVLRALSIAVTAKLEAGENPVTLAALVKDLGTALEQEIPRVIADAIAGNPDLIAPESLLRTVAYVSQICPSFSLRGGTREILRGMIARGLGLR